MNKRLVILAPNWVGDAVMAQPAIADLRRAQPDITLTVAARPGLGPLFALYPEVDETIAVSELGRARFDAALMLPNSFRSALVAYRAAIPERWGYRTDWRGPLLTKAVAPAFGLHQAAAYQHLVAALGYPSNVAAPT